MGKRKHRYYWPTRRIRWNMSMKLRASIECQRLNDLYVAIGLTFWGAKG
jgi:hypothetical protein